MSLDRGVSTPPTSWGLSEGAEIAAGRTALKRIGGGRRYETYLAWDAHLRYVVVAKLVRPHRMGEPRVIEDLRAEGEILRRLAHPALLRSFGTDVDSRCPHLVLEHVEGPTLRRALKRQRWLPIEQVLPLGLQVASVLTYLASERVVHLDVKPANVILGGPPRLIDLSLARTVDDARLIRAHIGTQAYMAPEQCVEDRMSTIGPTTDVWGLGVTMYEALTGRKAFGEPNDDGHYPQVDTAPQPMGKHVPPAVADLMARTLAQDPTVRPSAGAVANELEVLVADVPQRPAAGRRRARRR